MIRFRRLLSALLAAIICLTMMPLSGLAANPEGFDHFAKRNTFKSDIFGDVSEADWFYGDIKTVYELGLMLGKGDNTFDTESGVTIAEAITIAARIHSIYHTGSDAFEASDPWYEAYADYAYANGILTNTVNDYAKTATRAEFAFVLANALPAEALEEINFVNTDAIPDVKTSASYGEAVYKLYRAGIMIGNDDEGTFSPSSEIKRSEVAAIAARMADTSLRKSVSLGKEYTITFDMNGHGKQIPAQTVAEGGFADLPDNPEKAAYIFKGWYTQKNGGTQFNFDAPVYEDVTLYARWIMDPAWLSMLTGIITSDYFRTFTVDFESNGGTPVDSQTVKYGETVEIPADPVLDGYAFAGWYVDADLTVAYDFSGAVNSNLVLYAKWDALLTRGQWIDKLISTYGYPHDVVGTLATFADIEDSEYRTAIETAVVYGILQADPNGNFEPDAYATREFAAETAVRSMGYTPVDELICDDSDDIKNPAAAKQAIESGLMDLEFNKFNPKRTLRNSEAQRILDVAEEEFYTVDGSDDDLQGFVFLAGVVNKPGSFDWEVDGDKVILPAGEEIPEVGQIITFGTEKAIRVESVETVNGETRITYSTPELYEFLDCIDTAGEAVLDFSNFVPAEGVTVNYNSASPVQTLGFMDDWFDVPSETVDVNGEVELSGDIDLGDNWGIGYSVAVSIPTVSYKFDIDFDFNIFSDEALATVKNAYVKFQEDITVHVDFGRGVDTGDDEFEDSIYDDVVEKEIPLGSIPLVGIDGLCVEVEIDLILTASGKIVVDYNVHGTVGCQVLNNKLKNITALSSSVSVGLEAEFSAGPKLGLEAEVFGEDVLEFSVEAGANAGGSVHFRFMDPDLICDMVCMDATAYVYAHINALEDCLIDDWLDIGLTFTIWDDDNSPVKISGHWEDLVKVDECTYNVDGTIKGTVADADNRTQYIQNAKITVQEHDSFTVEKTVYSNRNGEYTATVPANTYLVKISADGYIPFESLETVMPNDTLYLETYLMVEGSEDSNETGTVSGIISNSVTGSGISDVTLTIRKGWNKTTGEIVATRTTNSYGSYNATLPLGNYTVLMTRDGYVTGHFNIAVTKNGNNNCHGVLTPDGSGSVELGDMRIILTWGATPRDLDSHLWGPTVDGNNYYHIYYSDMSYYHGGTRRAFLDVDDVTSYGPETTTVYDMNANGTYSFYVHDFTNRSYSNSTQMANSGAKVQVYMGSTLIATYNVPTSGVGNVWHVFDFDAITGTIKGVNTFSSCSYASNVGSPYALLAMDLDSAEGCTPDK